LVDAKDVVVERTESFVALTRTRIKARPITAVAIAVGVGFGIGFVMRLFR
jgi:ElaB/YqjD/DUF883 family membrane-anchored ribosome-binding protein